MVLEPRTVPVKASAKLIFIIEDDTDFVDFLVRFLTYETEYDVAVVFDGYQALMATKVVKPHLFILDYMLPDMNGIDLYDQLQKSEETANIPTIMLSAWLPSKEAQERKVVGIHKPFSLEELLNSIDVLLA